MGIGFTILGIFLGIIILLILITFHEFAHFIIAKLSKAHVYEFAIGIGPKIFKWQRKETLYSIRLFPFGGYVYIASEDVDPPSGREKEIVPDEAYIENIPRWKRLIFILAGSVFNFFIAAFLFTTIFASIGEKPNDLTYWGAKYQENYPVYNALKQLKQLPNQNNVILKYYLSMDKNLVGTNFDINKLPLTARTFMLGSISDIPTYHKTVYNFLDNLGKYKAGDPIVFEFIQVNKYHDVTKTPFYSLTWTSLHKGSTSSKPTVGIGPPNRIYTSTGKAYLAGWNTTFTDSVSILKTFGLLFTGQFSQLSGPVGIAKTFGTVFNQGGISFFLYVALLSANLFILNLIPIPPLDGYKFIEVSIEMIIRKEISKRLKIILNVAGVILFLSLLIGLTLKDLLI